MPSTSAPPAAADASTAVERKAAVAAAEAAAAERKAAARAAAQAEYDASSPALRTKRPAGMVKRSVALHVGYVGTAFNGLQVNREAAPDSTVEAVLERAVYGAGLIAESNFGDLHKVKWTRNSRTDKGVHSVATVVGLRVLLPGDERWEEDPEGLAVAAELNARLPDTVRVFSAQRVNKKFNARRFCFDRTYEYLLPAYLLAAGGGSKGSADAGTDAGTDTARQPGAQAATEATQGADAGGDDMAAAMGRLREALGCYVGTYPFHNYTARRKEYVSMPKSREERKAAREAREAAAAAAAATDGEGAVAVADAVDATDADESQMLAAAAAEAEATGAAASGDEAEGSGAEGAEGARSSRRPARRDDDEPLEEEDDEEDDDAPLSSAADDGEDGAAPRLWVQSCRWLYEKSATDPRDRVSIRHFRTISSFTAEDPAPLVPGGVPCIRLRVRGMSFMLHQIRHMIGGALAVARGELPLPLLRASLANHARVTVPRAPPHSLLLADSTFPPFRKHAGGDEARVSRWSGERLELRAGGRAGQADFRRQSLDPALNALLEHPDWAHFEVVLGRYHWDAQAQAEVMAAHGAWEAGREERARQRREEKGREAERAAEAAAAAAAAAEAGAGAEADAGDGAAGPAAAAEPAAAAAPTAATVAA